MGNPADKIPRAYRSELRTKAAAHTRATILASAMQLFLKRGYAKVTVNDIARQANLATPTVYASTGGKSAILATLIEERQFGDPAIEETLAAIRRSTSARDVIAATAHGTRTANERHHDIVQVMVAASSLDDAVAELLAHSDQGYRNALGQAARRLKRLRALTDGLTEARAVDAMWFLFGHRAWHLFVYDLQWSWDEAESFLRAQATSTLIAAPAGEPSG
jgi:AcrR family transcriptional regulator